MQNTKLVGDVIGLLDGCCHGNLLYGVSSRELGLETGSSITNCASNLFRVLQARQSARDEAAVLETISNINLVLCRLNKGRTWPGYLGTSCTWQGSRVLA